MLDEIYLLSWLNYLLNVSIRKVHTHYVCLLCSLSKNHVNLHDVRPIISHILQRL